MSVSKNIAQYKEMAQLQEYAMAQEQTILSLSKKNKKLEEERDHLKQLLEASVPIIREEGKPVAEKFLTSAEEAICTMQLEKLREISLERELTLEETRRVEIFSKILATFRNTPKTIELKSKSLKTEELLALVESNGTEK